MSINQVINGKNRLVEHPNRYRLNAVSGQANTYDFEKQPGEITEIGTPYSKVVLDKIDNVLSYLTPSVEKAEIVTPKEINKSELTASLVDSTFSDNSYIDEIDITYDTLLDGYSIQPKLKITTNATDFYLNYSQNSDNHIHIGKQAGYSFVYTPSDFLNLFKQKTKVTNNFLIFAGKTHNVYFDYDFLGELNYTFNYNFSKTASSNDESATFYVSNDNVNWTEIGIATYSSDETININGYRYFRILFYCGSNVSSNRFNQIHYAYFTNITGTAYYLDYQNQFTLDNNGTTFVNNQRVLVETPNPLTPIYTYNNALINTIDSFARGSSFNEINSILNDINNSSLKITTNNSNGFYDYDIFDWESYELLIVPHNNSDTAGNSTNFKNILNRTEKDSNYYVRLYQYYDRTYLNNTKIFFDYDFKVENMPKKLKINFSANVGTTDKCYLYESEDNINWNYVDEIISENIIENLTKRYYRVQFGNDDNTLRDLFIYYINWQTSIVEYIPTFLDGVTSNTLNGIDIPTLLQPSTKYELIYNEDSNKFELGGLLTLYDITLTEAVNQVNLTGIKNKLKIGKLYELLIIGSVTTTDFIYLGSNCKIGRLTDLTTTSSISLFTPSIFNNNIYLSAFYNNNGTIAFMAQDIDQEILKVSTASYNFKAGTRIIIKEVC